MNTQRFSAIRPAGTAALLCIFPVTNSIHCTIVAGNTTNTHIYSQDSSVNFTGSTFYIRDEKDVQALDIEIAALTRRRQYGRGLRMA